MAPQESKNWIELSIGDIADVIAGGTPQAGNPDNFQEPGTGIAWLTPADLSGYKEKYISLGARDLSQQGYDSSSAKLLPKGSIVFSSRAPIGYVAIAKNDISTNQGFKNFVFTHGVDSSFAYHYLRSIKDIAESLGTGTTFKEISGATAKTLPFVLPPLAEQKVIADKLDTLLAQVETSKARLERIPQILKTFRQSVLAAAVSGKLTEEWRGEQLNLVNSVESYRQQLELLRQEKHQYAQEKAGRKSKYKTPLNPEIDLSFKLPNSWLKLSLDAVSHRITYGLTTRPKYVENGVPIISAKEIRSGTVDYEGAKKFDEALFEGQREKCKIFLHDVLFSKTGSIGHVAYVEKDIPLCSSQNIAVISPLINYQYLGLVMKSMEIQKMANSNVKANAVPDLQLGIMATFSIPTPVPEEQTQIVRRVEELFAFADRIEQKANAALERVNNLTQSILAKAFRGELTLEWRAANPELISGENSAEALLKKIKAERAALRKRSEKKTATRKKA
ncbi:restriction endonuclease subunit S [Vibrio cholerae]|uniref:restriction endonuclease subunit S n=1 Tax=Vibrio cholerae TaxID=666 RepID=UPI0013B474FF|nr:restriction endonuclease subunit S [Vibrio cholerae]